MADVTWTPVTVRLSQLTPWERNPKRISKAHAARLLDLWQRLGQFQTIAIGPAGEVYDGHQRLSVLKAAHGKGFEVQALQSSRALSEKEREELTIAAHVGTTGSFDWDALSGWDAGELQAWGFDSELLQDWNTGAAALATMLEAEQPAQPDDPGAQIDKAAELQAKWQTATGQLWQLGEHRLICGDCTDAEVVARVMDGERAQLVVTSPPYNQNLDQFKPSGMQKESPAFVHRMASAYADSRPEPEYQAEQVRLLEMIAKCMTPDGSIFYNHKIRYRDKHIISPLEWLQKLSFPVRQEIIWDRGSSITLNARMFIPADERIYWLRIGDEFVFNDEQEIKAWGTVWDVAAKNDVQITAAFATEIPVRCIRAASRQGDIVMEPYSGSGTTLIACERLGRRARCVEIEPGYVAVALERWATMTGKTPTLLDGAP